jgi:hypothetical protein
MAITRSSTVYVGAPGDGPYMASGAQSATDVTIPTADFAIIFLGWAHSASNQHPTSVSLNGQSATYIGGAEVTGSPQVAAYYVPTPTSGSGKTLAWTNPVTYDGLGVAAGISFYTGADNSSGTASLVRSSGGANSASGTATTSTLTAVTNDFTIAGYSADPGSGSGVTTSVGSKFGAASYNSSGDLGQIEHSPTGNQAYNATQANGVAIYAVVMKPAAGGGTLSMMGQASF